MLFVAIETIGFEFLPDDSDAAGDNSRLVMVADSASDSTTVPVSDTGVSYADRDSANLDSGDDTPATADGTVDSAADSDSAVDTGCGCRYGYGCKH